MKSNGSSTYGSSKTESSYSRQDSSAEDSDAYSDYDSYGSGKSASKPYDSYGSGKSATKHDDSYGSGGSASKPYDSYAQPDPYSVQGSTKDPRDESSNSYGDVSSTDRYGTGSDNKDSNSNRKKTSYGNQSSYGDDADSYGSSDRQDPSRKDCYASGSSYNRDSVTRYAERQGAAADDSSTWSGGTPVTASPADPYAYGANSYEDSAAASANAAPKSGSLGLVPIADEGQSGSTWSNNQTGYGRDSSTYAGDSAQDRGSQSPSVPSGFMPLPPVDRSVPGPVLPPTADGSIPVYPSTAPQ
jgi:hypothetical protein